MEKTYRHRKSGELAYYKDGIIKVGNCSVEIGVEPSSEFWMEVDYEILSLMTNDSYLFYPHTILYYKGEDCIKRTDCGEPSSTMKLSKAIQYSKIHSVKRVKDNEIFTIGDLTNAGKIEMFELHGEHLMVKTDGGLTNFDNDLYLKKESVFTTFDNVEIYKNQSYWGLHTKTWLLEYVDGGIDYNLKEDELPDSTYLTFAEKENLEEYILMNKPLLSLNDLLSVWCSANEFHVYEKSPLFQNFKNLAKTKL
jgi:hypothetical protein